MTIIPERLPLIENLTLNSGSHRSFEDGACLLEAVSYVAGEPWSDHPQCASRLIGAFLRSWNDALNDDDRNRLLKPLVPRLVGTAGSPDDEAARASLALDWLVREHTPAWLRLAGLTGQADTLANLGEFKAGMDLSSIVPTIKAVHQDAVAARGAAGDAAWVAAWVAAWAAAGGAAWVAAGVAAGVAARDAAWDAAWGAAWGAAWDALQPTVEYLQTSALQLVDRMIAVSEAES